MKKKMITLCAAGLAMSASAQTVPQLTADNIDDIVKAMTLHEKAMLVVGSHPESAVHTDDLLLGAAGSTVAIPRLGIPPIVFSDGPAGLRIKPRRPYDSHTYYCTHFPIGTCLASTWNTQLVQQVGQAIGNEVLEYGADVLLAPGISFMRNPLCGRNYEYYSEDPVLSGNIAAAYINGVQSQGVGTSVKHFCFNNQETGRLGNDARVSQRAARELYLRNFEIAIKNSSPWTVMSSYNKVNGVLTSERRDLLHTILRDEWGYKGTVISDWDGGYDPIWRDNKTDRVANMKADNNIIEPGEEVDVATIENAIRNGQLSMEVLDGNVRHTLELIVKTPRFRGHKPTNEPDLKAHAAVTRAAAAEGTVLLENKGVLPLATNVKRVALYGIASYDPIAGGTGSGNVNRAYTVSLVEGMRGQGYIVDKTLLDTYTDYINKASTDETLRYKASRDGTLAKEIDFTPDELAKNAADNDVAVITLQRLSGEGLDREAKNFSLMDSELQLVRDITTAFHKAGKQAVVVLNIGGVVETASWKDVPDAILLPWQGGQEFGNSVADILSGQVAPSGKLPMTWPVGVMDAASSRNFPLNSYNDCGKDESTYKTIRNVGYTEYEEGIYVGYRYFDSFGKAVSYPFGYGLSYTTFGFSQLTLSDTQDKVMVTVTVTNTGRHAGKEVAEVYVTAPKGSVEKPEQELKAFCKTRLLQPGESETVTMSIDKRMLASFAEKKSAWVADAGVYTFRVGSSSRDIRTMATLKLGKYTENVHNVLAPNVKLNLLSKK